MADMEFAPLNFETPTMTVANGFDADGDITPSQIYVGTGADTGLINIVQNGAVDAAEIARPTITYTAEGIMSNIVNDIEQRIRIGNLDTSDPETFYDFLKMWPLYNDNGQVIGLFDTKEHRDQAKERLAMEKLKSKPRVNRLQQLLKKSTL
jgi:hypothetical protein